LSYLPYSLRCTSCQIEIQNRYFQCSSCQTTSTGSFKIQAETGKTLCVCQQCYADSPATRLPTECLECVKEDCDWWDTTSKTWAGLNLTPQTNQSINAIWITGNFDGDYVGDPTALNSEQVDSTGNLRSYRVKITKGFLSEVASIDGPPTKLNSCEKRPLTFAIVRPVDIEISKQNSTAITGRVALKDFRLHQWIVVGSTELSSVFNSKIVGRITGRAYGFLALDDAQPFNATTSAQTIVSKATLSPPNLTPANQKSQLADATSARTQTPNSVGDETASLKQEHKPCFAFSVGLNLILMILIALQCRVWTALGYALFISYVRWLDKQTSFRGQKIQSNLPRIAWSVLLILLGMFGVYGNQLPWLLEACQIASTLSILLTALALILSVRVDYCLLKCFLLVLLLTALSGWCTFNRTCQTSALPVFTENTATSFSTLPLTNAEVPIGTLAPFENTFSGLPSTHITSADTPANSTAPSLSEPTRFPNHTSSIVYDAQPTLTTPFRELASNLSNNINSLLNTAASTQASISLGSPIQGDSQLGSSRLISLDDAIRNPKLLDNCRTRIHIPFDYAVREIEPAVEEKLNLLRPQIRAHQGDVFVVTGHADSSGDETPEGYLINIQLSKARAEAVASLLVTKDILAPERIELRSAGSSMPISTAPDSLSFNRCWRRLNTDHLYRIKTDQGLLLI